MTGVSKSPPSVPSPPPTASSDRELRPLPHRAPSSTSTVAQTPARATPRPAAQRLPSVSQFKTELGVSRTGHRYSVAGSCVSCMAAVRDIYDKMHADHVKAESKASGH